jgi:hypothetical protein
MMICPYCRASFGGGESVVACLQCNTTHHPACWIENGNQCTVYRCNGFQEIATFKFSKFDFELKSRWISILLSVLIISNYVFHFFIPELKPVLTAIPLPDVAVVLTFEIAFIILSSLLLLLSLRCSNFTYMQDSVRFFAGMVLSINILFFVGLMFYGFTEGWQRLAASIYF